MGRIGDPVVKAEESRLLWLRWGESLKSFPAGLLYLSLKWL
jgi:hypothetical protein